MFSLSFYQSSTIPQQIGEPDVFWNEEIMANINEDSKTTASVTITMPPLQPSNITMWFALLETQLDAADITSDKIRFATLAKCLDSQLLQQIEGVMTDPPATGWYAKFKGELIHILTDTDSAKVKKLVEIKEMGDRNPSQFHHHLRKPSSPSTPDDFILTLWRNRLPTRIRRILVAVDDTYQENYFNAASGPDSRGIWRESPVYSSDNDNN